MSMYNYADEAVHFQRRKCSTSAAAGVQLGRYIHIVELLRLTEDEKNEFYSKAADGRHELPKDIVEYLTNNQAEIDGLRERMRV